jgi:hypothetical protein
MTDEQRYWCDVTKEDDGKRATVWAESTPAKPLVGESFTGVISCPHDGALPILTNGSKVHMFY